MTDDTLTLFRTLANLKETPRTGWLDRGIPTDEVESVADHTMMTALIAWVLALDDPSLDADRVLKLAIVHDLAEAIVGDRPPYEPHELPTGDPEALRAFFSVRHLRTPQNRATKQRDEAEAAAMLTGLMADAAADAVSALWQEYEERSTPEARFVKDVDTLEAFLQSRAYLRSHPEAPLWGFTDMARNEIDHPILQAIRDAELNGE
jgi:putative hydrolase of HD superfamily